MISSVLTALFDLIKSYLTTKDTEMKKKPTLEVIKDKKSLKKATNYTEQILLITDNYTEYFSKKDLRKYNSLKKKFNKNN